MVNGKNILIVLFVVVSVVILFWVVPFFTQPVGVPLDFYDISNSLNESDMDIYYIGQDEPFNKRVIYNTVGSVFQIPEINGNQLKAIIIDFKDNNTFTEADYEQLKSLYKDRCYYVILLNYSSNELDDIIDVDDNTADLIFLDFTLCNDTYFSSTLDFHPEIDLQNTQYLITHLLERKVD